MPSGGLVMDQLGVREFAGFRPGLCRLAEIQHHAPFDLARLEVGEDRIDVAQRRGLDLGPHLALDRKCDRLVEVAARSYDGTAHGDALQDNVEDRGGKLAWWQTDEADGSLPTHHAQ